jgi:hypothetical protein
LGRDMTMPNSLLGTGTSAFNFMLSTPNPTLVKGALAPDPTLGQGRTGARPHVGPRRVHTQPHVMQRRACAQPHIGLKVWVEFNIL